jgi:hypothetical protein
VASLIGKWEPGYLMPGKKLVTSHTRIPIRIAPSTTFVPLEVVTAFSCVS